MQFKRERVTAIGGREKKCRWRKCKFKLRCPGQSPVCQSILGRQERNVISILRSDTPAPPLWEKVTRSGEQDLAKTLCILFAALRSAWEVRAQEMDGLPGWTGTDREQQLCGSLDKMLTVWNHIKGCHVEDSVCGLAQIQNVLGGFVVFKDW